ncbi:MAG: cupin domain-containing protein [Gemmatimonadota bacterium]
MKRLVLAGVLCTALHAGSSQAQQASPARDVPEGRPEGGGISEHAFVLPATLEWQPGPSALPQGARMAIIRGDPAEPGLFTMRLRVPDGYRVQPHYHAADEHVTVISGTAVMGLGDEFDESRGTALPAGGFAVMPAGTVHFLSSRGETVIQVHAMGPWKLTYVDPTDDPRTASR